MQRFPLTVERWLLGCLPTAWRTRLAAASTHNKAAVRGMFWVLVFVLAAKGVAAAKEIAVAWRYGTSAELEGYLLMFNLASAPISLLSAVMWFSLVPALAREGYSTPQARRRQRQMTAWVWGVALVLTLITAWVLPPLLEAGVLGLSAAARDGALQTMPWLAAMVGLGLVASWHACQLMSAQRHANSFLEAIPALGILAAVLMASGTGVVPLVVGTLAGFAVQWGLTAWVVRMAGMPVLPQWPSGKPSFVTVSAAWLLGAQLVMSGAGVVDQLILAHLSQGSLATFGYANRIMALVLSLSALVVGRALLPVFSAIADPAESFRHARGWARRLFWAGVIAAVGIVLLAEAVVTLLYQRGAFTPQDTAAVAELLTLMALQLPFYLLGTVWVQWVLTRPGHALALWWAAVAGSAAKVAVAVTLIGLFDWGASAVAVALAVSSMVYWMSLRVFVRRDRVRH